MWYRDFCCVFLRSARPIWCPETMRGMLVGGGGCVLLLSSDRDLPGICGLSACLYRSIFATFRTITVINLASRINLRVFTVSYSRYEYNNEIN
jgi:hypothetical protein